MFFSFSACSFFQKSSGSCWRTCGHVQILSSSTQKSTRSSLVRQTINYILSPFCLILILYIYAFITVFATEHIAKHTPPSSPQESLHPHQSKASPPASHRLRKPLLVEGRTSVLLKSNGNLPKSNSVDETTANIPQTHRQSRTSKKQADSSKKCIRLSEEHKPVEASADLSISEVLFEEIRTLFKPMAPCLSPISDLVRIHCIFQQQK